VKKVFADMALLEHLEELRWRIVKSAIAIIVCAIPCGIYWKEILDIIMIYPLRFTDPKPKLIYTTPAESVMLSFQIALAMGLIISAPVVFFQIWRFVSPGLYKKERRLILPSVIASSVFFLAGILFCYFSFPILMNFLVAFAGNRIDPMFKANEYFGFLLKLSLSFGLVFELPVISFVLAKLGLLTVGFLLKNFRYAAVIIFIVAAVLTPPDIFSQTLLAIPLLVLYGLSILVVALVNRKNRSEKA
jgi:sec-independent protein translocase protein TatC